MTAASDQALKVLAMPGRMKLYFAYGSNMNRAAMTRRCPNARAIGPAMLEGYRFFVGLEGWGSVAPRAGDVCTACSGV